MLYRFAIALFVALALVLALGACGKSTDVTSPATTSGLQRDSNAQRVCWGTWDVSIDAVSGAIETVPLRTADFNANVLRFLQPPIAPIELVHMTLNFFESDLSNGLVTIDITLRHPFPGNNMFRGFDVHGIIMGRGETLGKHDASVSYHGPEGTRMLNPDGFTRWWNQQEFTTYGTIFGYTEGHYAHPGLISTSTVNPFKLHALGLEPTQPVYQLDPDTRYTFPAVDGVFMRRYRLQFDTTQYPVFGFKYAVDAAWSLPDPAHWPKYPIEAFDEMANCQEAYMLKIEEYEEIPYYVDEWVSGGDIIMLLTIGDWQATSGNVLDEVSHVWLESPVLFEFPVDVRDTMEFVESTHDTQATYRISLEDMAPDGLKGQQLLITVESADPDTYEPQIAGDTSVFVWPDAPLAVHLVVNVPITNLTPQGDYAYVYFIPDWCATMRTQCARDADNQKLLTNIMRQNLDGPYNDFTHVKIYEGRSHTSGQRIGALQATCDSLGYTVERDLSVPWEAEGCRVVITVLWNMWGTPLDPPFSTDECDAMLEFIKNGGILFFMCEASDYINEEGLEDFFEYLGMLMEYGGGATPEWTDGYTTNITWHWLTDDIELYHYFTCGQWITMDPHVLCLIRTELDEKLVLMYPLPLE